jgi:lipopolysaccharide/colanic/teichoic acid biosynthesis glycosyltransferase
MALKRSIDLILASLVTVFLFWLIIVLWVAVKIQSAGPGIFAQVRVGKDQRLFTCYKFRTMSKNSAQVGTHEIDPQSITTIGALLRKAKLDELPQIWNVFRNEMSFVGPRPCLPTQIDVVQNRQKLGVFDIKPGITGLSQVLQIDMSQPYELSLSDQQYVLSQSTMLDLKILFRTLLGKGSGDKVKKSDA